MQTFYYPGRIFLSNCKEENFSCYLQLFIKSGNIASENKELFYVARIFAGSGYVVENFKILIPRPLALVKCAKHFKYFDLLQITKHNKIIFNHTNKTFHTLTLYKIICLIVSCLFDTFRDFHGNKYNVFVRYWIFLWKIKFLFKVIENTKRELR